MFSPLSDDEPYYILPHFWLPEETLDLRVRRDHVPYDVRKRQGYLNVAEGNIVVETDAAENIKNPQKR